MPTLNQVKDFVADRLDRPFDDMLKAEVKFAFINEISLLMRRSIDANGLDKTYLATFNVELQLVTETDDTTFEGEHNILRSINKIPTPIRYKTPFPFVSVGTATNDVVFGYSPAHESGFIKELPYIGQCTTYDYINQYLYIRGNNKYKKVRITAPYANFSLIADNSVGGNGITYADDMELPYPEDLINAAILSLLQGVFSNLDAKDKIEATHLDNQ